MDDEIPEDVRLENKKCRFLPDDILEKKVYNLLWKHDPKFLHNLHSYTSIYIKRN